MPPTIREIPATLPSKIVIVDIVEFIILEISSCERILKSSSSPSVVFVASFTRLERGDKIIDEVSGITYDLNSFHKFVKTNFSSYITSQVFDTPDKAEKVYFSLEKASPDGHAYNMIMTDSSKNKTYKWISSLSERFSLVEMIATGIVYLKDIKTNTYQPFISGNGKYCRYDSENGQIVEL